MSDKENSGLSCKYYDVTVRPIDSEEEYTIGMSDMVDALGLDAYESVIFSEIFRTANARTNGLAKEGNTPKRAWEKIFWHAERKLKLIEREVTNTRTNGSD